MKEEITKEQKELLEALSVLDQASAKASLTRAEHVLVQQSIDKIKQEIVRNG